MCCTLCRLFVTCTQLTIYKLNCFILCIVTHVGRAVASNTRGPQFKSGHRLNFTQNTHLLIIVPKDTSEAGNGPVKNYKIITQRSESRTLIHYQDLRIDRYLTIRHKSHNQSKVKSNRTAPTFKSYM